MFMVCYIGIAKYFRIFKYYLLTSVIVMALENLHKEIGTAKDNQSSPIHDWYRFTAGFSYKLIDKIIAEESLSSRDRIYESFAGCGTTLVSAQKRGISAVGNEGQELLFDIIKSKLNWNIPSEKVMTILKDINAQLNNKHKYTGYHKLLESLYKENDLSQLYFIRDYITNMGLEEEVYLFLKLGLTQSLHKVSIHPIAAPYISRSKTLFNKLSAFEMFEKTIFKMLNDLEQQENLIKTSEIFLHDSRKKNIEILDNSCSICITSPPYLNNLDYGEVSKVCSHFYGITDSWGEITEKVRKKLVTGSTTHYSNNDFSLDTWKNSEFYLNNEKIGNRLISKIKKIRAVKEKRKGTKSFDILTLYYFEDMFKVLLEMRRVLKPKAKAYLVLGDSAPYGVYINTTKVLGQIAKNAGFSRYKIVKIRERGTKWKSLKFRHNLKLSESILILE